MESYKILIENPQVKLLLYFVFFLGFSAAMVFANLIASTQRPKNAIEYTKRSKRKGA